MAYDSFLCRLCSAFGRLLTALLRGQRILHRCCSAFGLLLAALLCHQCVLPAPLVSLVGRSLCSCCSCQSTLLLRERHAQAAVLLISQTCESALALLLLQSLAGEPDMEAAAAKPYEDGLGCHHLPCKSSTFGHKATSGLVVEKVSTTCSLLVEKPLMTGGLLVFVGGMLFNELLATIGFLALTSGFLVKMALAGGRLEEMALVLPQSVDCPLPILVGVFRAGASPM